MLLRGKVLDRDTQLPLAGAWVVRKGHGARTRTAADGSFVLPVPQAMMASQLIAAAQPLTSEETQAGLGHYIPHYVTAQPYAVVQIRRVPPSLGRPNWKSAKH
ncbi:MAG: hypothetical protein WKG07_26635 [Hymenobacter sp.]